MTAASRSQSGLLDEVHAFLGREWPGATFDDGYYVVRVSAPMTKSYWAPGDRHQAQLPARRALFDLLFRESALLWLLTLNLDPRPHVSGAGRIDCRTLWATPDLSGAPTFGLRGRGRDHRLRHRRHHRDGCVRRGRWGDLHRSAPQDRVPAGRQQLPGSAVRMLAGRPRPGHRAGPARRVVLTSSYSASSQVWPSWPGGNRSSGASATSWKPAAW